MQNKETAGMSDLRKIVKPLEWSDYATADGTEGQLSHTSLGLYLCVSSGWFLVGQSGRNDADTPEAAKTAAQADHENRILSAVDADAVQAMIDAAVKEERERCARVAYEYHASNAEAQREEWVAKCMLEDAEDIAAAIRGNT